MHNEQVKCAIVKNIEMDLTEFVPICKVSFRSN